MLSEAKTTLENKLYQPDIESYCTKDSKNMAATKDLERKVGVARRHNALIAARCFDLHREYPGFSLGEKEFQI